MDNKLIYLCNSEIKRRLCLTFSGVFTMRHTPVHDSQIFIRANGALVAALGQRARASGVTVSEYLRGLIRERVGLN